MRYMKKRCVRAKKQEATKTTKDGRIAFKNNQAGRMAKRKELADVWKAENGICLYCKLQIDSLDDAAIDDQDDERSIAHRRCIKNGQSAQEE